MADPAPPADTTNLSPAQRNVRNSRYRYLFVDLPEDIQKLAAKAFKLFASIPIIHHFDCTNSKTTKKAITIPAAFR